MSKVSFEEAVEGELELEVERRRSRRASIIVRIDYATVDEIFTEFTRDINEGGLFIETEKPKPIGTEVAMHFALPGSDEVVQTIGRVVRISSGEDAPSAGMGIEFDELEDEDRRKINDIVRSLRTGTAKH